jgi:haloalkane dehalogenase
MSLEKKTFDVEAGSMAYIDTGAGPAGTVVFVHGNPASSAEFVPAIEQLADTHRCVAVDHIGFGGSDKPHDWDYLPISHAANLTAVLGSLDLHDVTMVVGDWGGPIGCSWALDHPDRVGRLVITNTWLWPVNRSWYYQGFSKAMGGPVGRYMIRNHNAFAKSVVKRAWGTRTPLTPELHRVFTDVHPNKDERKGMWVFPGEIVGSTEWLRTLWSRRETLHEFDISLLWGMKDIAFRADVLDRWIQEFPDADVTRLDDVGHFVALEAPDALTRTIRA